VNARDAALRVAVLSCLLDAVKAEHSRAREAAQEVFAPARKDGQTQQKVLLPDGTEIGLISIRGASPEVRLNEAGALFGWCKENAPQRIERYLAEGAEGMADVIALVAEHFPNLVRERIRPADRASLDKQMAETDGYVISDDGEKTRMATVIRGEPTGAFAYRPAKGAQDRIVAEWMAGNLREIALGPLALPGNEQDDRPCPIEAVLPDGTVPCTLAKGHEGPHVYADTLLPFDGEVS
jgi:hypothetical protein